MPSEYVPLLVFVLAAIAFAVLAITVSSVLGPKSPSATKAQPYECGIVPAETARRRLPVGFYLTAMLFIVFDVEAIFVYPWAVILRQLSVRGLVEMAVFVGALALTLGYVWRKGALEWE
ncbi:MAG TPA: NADH-quinone oxidoreductase subunit A [Candidatus Dormibacteraeota bacterium]|jgi:NADH-quinone oxidoreductase subunit A|nr:NADH-quinone oxidoreductase subunit A [Candidatus Dormibacteraeota bacterium]